MSLSKIVLNASPVIALYKANLEFILPKLFEKIVITEEVFKEIIAGKDRAASEIKRQDWLKVETIQINTDILTWNLGIGESSVLSYALRNKNFRAVIDDAAARRCAKTFNIKFLGTGSILVLATRKGLINSFDNAIMDLKNAGLWVSDSVIVLLKKKL